MQRMRCYIIPIRCSHGSIALHWTYRGVLGRSGYKHIPLPTAVMLFPDLAIAGGACLSALSGAPHVVDLDYHAPETCGPGSPILPLPSDHQMLQALQIFPQSQPGVYSLSASCLQPDDCRMVTHPYMEDVICQTGIHAPTSVPRLFPSSVFGHMPEPLEDSRYGGIWEKRMRATGLALTPIPPPSL